MLAGQGADAPSLSGGGSLHTAPTPRLAFPPHLACPSRLALPPSPVFPPSPGLQGTGSTEFMRDMQRHFTKVSRMRVDASRSMSREFYAVGLGRKGGGAGLSKKREPGPAGSGPAGLGSVGVVPTLLKSVRFYNYSII